MMRRIRGGLGSERRVARVQLSGNQYPTTHVSSPRSAALVTLSSPRRFALGFLAPPSLAGWGPRYLWRFGMDAYASQTSWPEKDYGFTGMIIVSTRFRFLLLLALSGCLTSDPENVAVEKALSPDSSQVLRDTQAPLQLDPSILASRSFSEAPILEEKVRLGELPPVAERLPEHPLVVVPMEEIGTYGGTLRRALTGDVVQTAGVSKTIGENIMGFQQPLPKHVLLNLAESYEFQDEGRTAIFRIRKGVKWSDGVPFTTDDIVFWYQDMTVDADARSSPLFPVAWLVEGKPLQLDQVDDYTIRFRSHKPLGQILYTLATGDLAALPKHYFAKYHPKYNPDATYESLRDTTSSAMRLYKPGTPVLSPWMPVEWTRGQRIVYERNPYYYKVDSAGNQLPYADRLVFNIIQDTQVILLRFINGQIDLFGRYAQTAMFPTLKAAEREGRVKIHLGTRVPVSTFRLNWDAPRPQVRKALRDRRVRLALSYAMNRKEISQILYHGLLDPAGYSFAPPSNYYADDIAKTYARFDPDRARALLQEAGYRDADGDGLREFHDGTVFALTLDVIPGMGVDVCQLVSDHWRLVGVGVNLNVGLRDIQFPRWTGGEFEVFWWWSWSEDAIARAQDWGPIGPNVPTWHRNAATEGPEWLKECARLIQDSQTTLDQDRVRRNMLRIRDLHTEQVALIFPGYAHPVWGSSTRLGNVPEQNTTSSAYRGWSRPVFHEQLYIKN